MFKIAEVPKSYTWPVVIYIPADGGKTVKATFDAEFKALEQERINDYIAGAGRESETDLLDECVIGWKGVIDADGNDMPYSEHAKAKLIAIPYVRSGLVRAFFESITGGARRKN